MAILSVLLGLILAFSISTHSALPSVATGLGAVLFLFMGVLSLRSEATSSREWRGFWFSLALLVCLAPEGYRRWQSAGWNSAFRPASFGPGDTIRVNFPKWIRSVRGLWRGTASAQLLVSEEPPRQLKVETSDKRWGSKIPIPRSGGTTQKSSAFVQVQLPDTEDLVGKSVRLDITLKVEYPQYQQGGGYSLRTETFRRTESVILGSMKLGQTYHSLCLLGVICGAVCAALGSKEF